MGDLLIFVCSYKNNELCIQIGLKNISKNERIFSSITTMVIKIQVSRR